MIQLSRFEVMQNATIDVSAPAHRDVLGGGP